MSFPCTKCGLCCRHVDRSELTTILDRGDGICIYLNTHSAECKIYRSRPQACRIDSSFIYFSEQMTLTNYYKKNAIVCNALQLEHGAHTYQQVVILENT